MSDDKGLAELRHPFSVGDTVRRKGDTRPGRGERVRAVSMLGGIPMVHLGDSLGRWEADRYELEASDD